MKVHHQIVAVLHIASGALALVGALVVLAAIGLPVGITISEGEMQAAGVLGIIAFFIVGFLMLLGLPGIIGGIALYRERPWARIFVLVLGFLHLANVPFGTALGVYTIWALLLNADKQPQLPSPPAA